jgi:hypothetical protein
LRRDSKRSWLAALLVLLSARVAHAEEAPPTATTVEAQPESDVDARELARVSALVHARAEEARRSRVWQGVGTMALGAVSAGAGAFVLTRGARVPGFVVVAEGGGALLLGAYSTFLDAEPFEDLATTLERYRLAGASAPQILAAVHVEREVLAARSRSRRFAGGLALTIVGSLLTSAALVVALRSPADLDLTGQEQALSVAAVVGTGVTTASRGVAMLVTPALVEEPLDLATRASSTQATRVSFVPSGGIATLQVLF